MNDAAIMDDVENLITDMHNGRGAIFTILDKHLTIKQKKQYILLLRDTNIIDINYVDTDGSTALLSACKLDSIPLVKFLLDEFPEIKIRTSEFIYQNELLDPLIYCMKENKSQYIIHLLFERVNIKEYLLKVLDNENNIIVFPYPFIMELFGYFINKKGHLPLVEQQLDAIDLKIIDHIITTDRLSILLDCRYRKDFYSLLNIVIASDQHLIGDILVWKLLIHMDTFDGIEELFSEIDTSNIQDTINKNYISSVQNLFESNCMICSIIDVIHGKITLEYHLSKYPERRFCFSKQFLQRIDYSFTDNVKYTYSPLHYIIELIIPITESVKEMISIDRQILNTRTIFSHARNESLHGLIPELQLKPTTPLEFAIFLYHKSLCGCHKNQSTHELYKIILALIKLGASIKISKSFIKEEVRKYKEFKHFKIFSKNN